MEVKLTGTPEEIKNLLDAIGGSREQISYKDIKKLFKHVNGMEEGWKVDSELIKLRLQLIKEVLERALKTKSLIKKLILVKLYELLNR